MPKSKFLAKLRGRKKKRSHPSGAPEGPGGVVTISVRQLPDSMEMPDGYEAPMTKQNVDMGDAAALMPQVEAEEEEEKHGRPPRPGNTEIKAVDLFNAFVTKHADEDRLFREEFESMPAVVSAMEPKSEYAKRPENKEKNRYRNVVTCDSSRVKLSQIGDDEFSDYINASYIDGYEEDRKFIAAQGPKENTLGDFWRMIWEQRCYVIVMITELRELGRKKCEQYWPNEGTVTYGSVTIASKELIDYGSFTKRLLEVTNRDFPDETPRTVSHFQYRAWPDHGTPKTTSEIFRFWARTSEAQPKKEDNPGPLVIHCSAGVGRTGTYIALDVLIGRLLKESKVDVYSLIVELRQRRTEMVQSLDQYVLLHKLVAEYHMYGDTDVNVEDFRQSYDRLSESDGRTRTTGFECQFELLRRSYPMNGRTGSGNLEQNRCKNRDQDVIPYDHSKAFVRMRPTETIPLYVNASVLQGYDVTKSIIATQAPMEHTVEDFWRVVLDNNVKCIVMLTPLKTEEKNFCHPYFPESGSERYGEIVVHNDAARERAHFVETSFTVVSDEKDTVPHSVTHLRYTSWVHPDFLPPHGAAAVLEMIDFVRENLKQIDSKPRLLVHCSDGAGRTGVFCAVLNLVERLLQEKRIDVFRSVKDVRDYRQNMVRTVAQFKMCHDIILRRTEPRDDSDPPDESSAPSSDGIYPFLPSSEYVRVVSPSTAYLTPESAIEVPSVGKLSVSDTSLYSETKVNVASNQDNLPDGSCSRDAPLEYASYDATLLSTSSQERVLDYAGDQIASINPASNFSESSRPLVKYDELISEAESNPASYDHVHALSEADSSDPDKDSGAGASGHREVSHDQEVTHWI